MLKKYLLIFFGFFTVFTCIGMVKGWQWRNDPEYLNKRILQRIGIRIEQKHYYLQYACERQVYQYDIDSNQLRRKLGAEALRIYVGGPRSGIPIDEKLILGILGGSTAGYTFKNVVTRLQGKGTKSIKEIIAAIAGAISGYSFGFWVVSRIEPACDARSIVQLLEQTSNWKNLKQKMWMARYTSVSLVLHKLGKHLNDKSLNSEETEKFNKLKLRFDEVTKRAEEVDYDFKSSDFLILDDMKAFLKKVLMRVSSKQQ